MEAIFTIFSKQYKFEIRPKNTKDKSNNEQNNSIDIIKNNILYKANLINISKYTNTDKSLISSLKESCIIRKYNIYEKEFENTKYILIIMERAKLKDLRKFVERFHRKDRKMFNIINMPFHRNMGDNLMRFFSKQIIRCMELLDRKKLVHFEIKPENFLINNSLKIALSEFKFLTKINKNNNDVFEKPDFIHGYITPELIKKSKDKKENNITGEMAKKNDYFSLGATLYFMKFGEQRIEYNDNNLGNDTIIDLIQNDLIYLNSRKSVNVKFINFLNNLIKYKLEDIPSFEKIYRSEWLYENQEEINNLTNTYRPEEEDKLILEFMKSDFLVEKKNKSKKKRNFIFEED